jgi:AcrR family transcriptional regulator
MPRVRTEDKTDAILEAALRRFLHYGLKKTSMQEVAKDAGVGVGTLYLYFKDKDALVAGCAERFAVQHRAEAEGLLASRKRADKKLKEYLQHRYRVWQEVGLKAPGAMELAEAILRLSPEKVVEGAEDLIRNIRAILADGKACGTFPRVNPERDARVLALSLMGFFPIAGREPPVRLGEAELLLVVDWFIQRFTEEAGRGGSLRASPKLGHALGAARGRRSGKLRRKERTDGHRRR